MVAVNEAAAAQYAGDSGFAVAEEWGRGDSAPFLGQFECDAESFPLLAHLRK